MPHFRTCSWCRAVNTLNPNAATFCECCFHRADCSQGVCNCPICVRPLPFFHPRGHAGFLLTPTLVLLAHSIGMLSADDREAVMCGLRRNMESPLYSTEQRRQLGLLWRMIEAKH